MQPTFPVNLAISTTLVLNSRPAKFPEPQTLVIVVVVVVVVAAAAVVVVVVDASYCHAQDGSDGSSLWTRTWDQTLAVVF